MKLEQQVVSLELAKKLKELGVKQESLFWWGKRGNSPHKIYPTRCYEIVPGEIGWYEDVVSAFTVAELGEMLPEKLYRDKAGSWNSLKIVKGGNDWYVEYYDISFNADTEADARAKMLCYLLENKLIQPTPKA